MHCIHTSYAMTPWQAIWKASLVQHEWLSFSTLWFHTSISLYLLNCFWNLLLLPPLVPVQGSVHILYIVLYCMVLSFYNLDLWSILLCQCLWLTLQSQLSSFCLYFILYVLFGLWFCLLLDISFKQLRLMVYLLCALIIWVF